MIWFGPKNSAAKFDVDDADLPDTVRFLKCDTGDIVICRTYEGCIIPKDSTPWEKEKPFKVIGTMREDGVTSWALYIPPDYGIKNGTKITPWIMNKFNIEAKYKGDKTFFVVDEHIIKVHRYSDALRCSGPCKQWIAMAEPNQENGTFICWECRDNPWR